jgi:RNA polymerase sigma-70 factor (ECF subfamily)
LALSLFDLKIKRSSVTDRPSVRLKYGMDQYSAFYREHKDRLFAYLMRMTGDYDLSRDIMQESFTRYMERYRCEPLSGALLFTIARNAFLNTARKRKRDCPLEDCPRENCRDEEKAFMIREEYRRVLAAFQKLEALRAHQVVREALAEGMPVEPVVSKAYEGIAKRVSDEAVVKAMETVHHRFREQARHRAPRGLARDYTEAIERGERAHGLGGSSGAGRGGPSGNAGAGASGSGGHGSGSGGGGSGGGSSGGGGGRN